MPGNPWDARAAAKLLELRTTADLDGFELPPPHDCFSEIRFYLQRMTDTRRTANGPRPLSRRVLDTGETQINAGPTVFHQGSADCIQFRSGAQLAFGISLRVDAGRTKILSYRFHLQLLPSSGLHFVRIDLNPVPDDDDPLQRPRSHIHPGFENVHLPFPVMRPLEVLDRIFHVIEPAFTP